MGQALHLFSRHATTEDIVGQTRQRLPEPSDPRAECSGIDPEPGPVCLVFLYRRVLEIEIADPGPLERAKRPRRLPEVLPCLRSSRF